MAKGRMGWGRLLVALAGCLVSARARAGNDDSILLGNDAALVAGAVVSSVNDGSALWYNPAGLARAAENSVDVGASAFALRRYNMPSFISAEGGRGGDASFTEIVSIPSAVTYTRRYGKQVFGFGLFASQVSDYTLRASLSVPIGGVVDGNIRLLLNQEVARYHAAIGWARALPRGFSFGVSLFGDYYSSSGFQQITNTFDLGVQPVGVYVNSSFATDTLWGLHLRAGVVWEARPDLRFGLSVQSPGVYVARSGQTTLIETSTSVDAQGQTTLEAGSLDAPRGQAQGLYAPVRVRLGGSGELGGVTLSLEGDLQSKLREREIDLDRELTWNVRAGARFSVGEHVRLGAGFFTDRGSERTDQWGAGNIDFYGATLGGQYTTVRWLATESSGGDKRAGLTFSSTVALRYAVGVGKLQGQRLTLPDYEAVTRAVDLTVHELTLHLGSGVYF